MYKIKKVDKYILLLILIIFLSIKIGFFKNIHKILSESYEQRISDNYHYCSEEGIGYLRYIKNKYEIKSNPIIINYVHVPNNNWAIINTRIINNNKNKKLIFLNYPGYEKKIKLKKIKKDLYEFIDVGFFIDKYSKIEKIEINSKIVKSKKIEIFTIDKSLKKKNIKEINTFNSIYYINLNFKDINLSEKKLFFEINNLDKDAEINLLLINKYLLNNYKIIDKFKNCYYVE